MKEPLFYDRPDAARQLAERLKESEGLELRDPLVLGVPRGGAVIAAELAKQLNFDMDVALARKLRHPVQPELAIGAVSEDGEVYLNARARPADVNDEYLQEERDRRLEEFVRHRDLFRGVRVAASIAGRSVIITDDAIATGSTMFAVLQIAKAKEAHETIVAVPVAPPQRLEQIRQQCDLAICLSMPDPFWAVGGSYGDFERVSDECVCELLREFAPVSR
jgi:predicted phosphoribosyltransferase